jgi:hypothetical protein
MKYSWMILGCLLCSGCWESQYFKNLEIEKDKVTISQTYYLTTVLHNEHLFIVSNSGYFIHHPDCECPKHIQADRSEKANLLSPIIIEGLPSVLIKP